MVAIAALIAVCGLAGCWSDGDDKPEQGLRFEMGEQTSAFRDIGKRAASELD